MYLRHVFVLKTRICIWGMELSESLMCPCNNHVYASRKSLATHRRTNAHQLWEMPNTIRDLNIRVNRLENENGQLKRDVERLEALNQLPKVRVRSKVILGEKIKSFVQFFDSNRVVTKEPLVA